MATKSNRSSGSQLNARGVAQGNTLVDPRTGLPIDVVVDSGGVRRLAVDSNITLTGVTVDVDLDVATDGVHIGNPSTGDILLVNPDGSINANVNVDAASGDNIAISGHSSPLFSQSADTLTTLAFAEIFTYTSTNSNTKIIKLECTSETPTNFVVKINGIIVKYLRSSPIERNIVFKFDEHRPLPSGDVISVEGQVERLIQVSYTTFVSMEGYIA